MRDVLGSATLEAPVAISPERRSELNPLLKERERLARLLTGPATRETNAAVLVGFTSAAFLALIVWQTCVGALAPLTGALLAAAVVALGAVTAVVFKVAGLHVAIDLLGTLQPGGTIKPVGGNREDELREQIAKCDRRIAELSS
jgi:hypothetical protein